MEALKVLFTSDVGLLNRAMLWASTDPRAANQAFNIGNGETYDRYQGVMMDSEDMMRRIFAEFRERKVIP